MRSSITATVRESITQLPSLTGANDRTVTADGYHAILCYEGLKMAEFGAIGITAVVHINQKGEAAEDALSLPDRDKQPTGADLSVAERGQSSAAAASARAGAR